MFKGGRLNRRELALTPMSPAERVVEGVKSVLIVLLSCSAVFLAGQTPVVHRVRDWVNPEPMESAVPTLRQSDDAVLPYGAAVRNSGGLYGVSYDRISVESCFQLLTPALEEALRTAQGAEPVSPERWLEHLDLPGFYCVFQGPDGIPLELLGGWLGHGAAVTGSARDLLLCWDGTQVWLNWRDGGVCMEAGTGLDWREDLEPLLRNFVPNGAAFAHTLAASEPLYERLDPCVLIGMTPPRPGEYSVTAPNLVDDREELRRFLGGMGFESDGGSAYDIPEGLAFNEEGDRLRISRDGYVMYHGDEDSRYRVPSVSEQPTASEAALAAWELANQAVSVPSWKGDGSLVVTGVRERQGQEEPGWQVTLHYRLEGIPVLMRDTGWAAEVLTEGREITDFSLHLRTYSARETVTAVPSERLTAAALEGLNGRSAGAGLTLCYTDSRTASTTTPGVLTAGWMTDTPEGG